MRGQAARTGRGGGRLRSTPPRSGNAVYPNGFGIAGSAGNRFGGLNNNQNVPNNNSSTH
jgi:hypothetical protein